VRAVVVVVGVVGAVVVVALLSESLSCPLAGADLKMVLFGYGIFSEMGVWKEM
jgi:hypothetical protein